MVDSFKWYANHVHGAPHPALPTVHNTREGGFQTEMRFDVAGYLVMGAIAQDLPAVVFAPGSEDEWPKRLCPCAECVKCVRKVWSRIDIRLSNGGERPAKIREDRRDTGANERLKFRQGAFADFKGDSADFYDFARMRRILDPTG
jgi:hypothetical protein